MERSVRETVYHPCGMREAFRLLTVNGLLLCAVSGCVPDDPPEGPRRRPGIAGVRGRAALSSERATTSEHVQPAKPPVAPAELVDALPALATNPEPSADPRVTEPFSDDFERSSLGPSYRTTSSAWRISHGRLCGTRAHNRPVWLARKLPKNARIEFEASSESPDGDIKVEFWGDGKSGATSTSYTDATSYLAIFGGWRNTLHVLARLDEHGQGRKELRLDPEADDPRLYPVQAERQYRFRIERRDGRTLRWLVDDIEILTLSDKEPLEGDGHDHFGFNDWETPVCFDNLEILPFD